MRLSDYKGEDAIDLLADILDPATEILADSKIKDAVRSKQLSRTEIIKMVLKEHKKAIIKIMAIIEGVDPDTYQPNVLTLPVKLVDMLNDEEFLQLFQLQGQMGEDAPSGSATENTKATGKG